MNGPNFEKKNKKTKIAYEIREGRGRGGGLGPTYVIYSRIQTSRGDRCATSKHKV